MNSNCDDRSRRGFSPSLIALVLVCSFALAQPAFAARIVVFGDSWGVPAAPALQTVLINNGLPDSVFNAAVGGETAANLSTPSGLQQISASLTANLDADLVHLSISGNDFLGQWNSSFTPVQQDALFQTIIADVETIVDHIIAERPGVQILWSSYDFPRPLPLGTPTEVNAAGSVFAALAAALAASKGPSLTYIDFSGLMQVTYGFDGSQPTVFDPPFVVPPGDPSLPDPTLPSPAVSFIDAIHLTADGYAILAGAHFDQFYSAILVAPAAPASNPWTRVVLTVLLFLAAMRWVQGYAAPTRLSGCERP